LKYYDIKSQHLDGATGVWLIREGRLNSKICSIGVKAGRKITMHGFAFNVNANLKYFDYINPCGYKNIEMTSIEKELGKKVQIKEVSDLLIENFSKFFKINISLDE